MVANELERWLISRLAELRGVDPRAIDIHERFSRYGLDSMGATRLAVELTGKLGRPLSPTLLWEYPTIEALVLHLCRGEGVESPALAGARLPLQAKAAPRLTESEPVAVVGMACRFPKAPSLGRESADGSGASDARVYLNLNLGRVCPGYLNLGRVCP